MKDESKDESGSDFGHFGHFLGLFLKSAPACCWLAGSIQLNKVKVEEKQGE